MITTVAGTGSSSDSGDGGAATSAGIGDPREVALLPGGGFLIADHVWCTIRKVDATGKISTVAGVQGATADCAPPSGLGGPATSSTLEEVTNIATLPAGGFLLADGPGDIIEQVNAAGTISEVAGTGTSGFMGDTGPATSAEFANVRGISLLPGGGYMVADAGNNRIRAISPTGTITTVAGSSLTAGFGGDNGPATAALLNDVEDVAALPDGGFLIADSGNNRIRKVEGYPPSRLTSPAISGTVKIGSTVTCTPGSWTNDATTFTHSWALNGVTIPGAVGPTYPIVPTNGGRSLTCSVIATNDVGASASATSAAAAVPALPPPTISHARQSHKTWRTGNRLAHITSKQAKRPPVGTRFSFALNETANVKLTFELITRSKHHKHTKVKGTLKFTGHAGTNKVVFDGRISSHSKLKPGSYKLVISATNVVGTPGRTSALSFTIAS